MKKGLIITGSILAVSAIAYMLYKKTVPPRFTVRDFSDTTMQGNYEWGKAAGSLSSNGGFSAGWGWDGQITSDAAKKQYRLDVTKDGKPYKSIIIENAGNYNI